MFRGKTESAGLGAALLAAWVLGVCDLHERWTGLTVWNERSSRTPLPTRCTPNGLSRSICPCILRCVSRFLRLITCSRRNNASESITSAIRLCLENVEICLGVFFLRLDCWWETFEIIGRSLSKRVCRIQMIRFVYLLTRSEWCAII